MEKQALNEKITVITVTSNRVNLLERAIKSVKNQTINSKIHHFIYIDDCPKTLKYLEKHYLDDSSISWFYYKRNENDISGPALLARLRNDAVNRSNSEWLSYLDDDNEFESDHLEKLYEFATKNNYEAVHSHVKVFTRDKTPYLFEEERWPWARTERSISKYRFMLEMGLICKGSNIRKYQYGIVIDTNVWLVKKEIWELCKISDDFSAADWKNNLAEDDKLMEAMLLKDIPVHCNNEATVIYYLGGYSNDFEAKSSGTIIWEKI